MRHSPHSSQLGDNFYAVSSSLVLVWPLSVRIPESLPTKVVNCVFLCTLLLPLGVNPSAVNKYINISSSVFKTIYKNTLLHIIIVIIIKSFHSLWSIGHQRRASRHCDIQLSPWPRSMIILCFLSHPLLSFATFSSAYHSFYIAEDSNLIQFSLLLLFLYVMSVQSNSIFFFLSDSLLTYDEWFSTVLSS